MPSTAAFLKGSSVLGVVAAVAVSVAALASSPAAPDEEPRGGGPAPGAERRDCMADPSACGYPDVRTVGVRAGKELEKVEGTVTLSKPGEVYENKLVTGSIAVTAPDVTIRNVKLVATDDWYGIRAFGSEHDTSGLLIEDVELDLNGKLGIKGIAFDGYTARNVFFHNGSDCAHMGNDVTIEDSLCVVGPDADGDGRPDDTAFCDGDEHFDGFQSDGGERIVLRHNTVRLPCSQTSAILLSSNTSPIRDVTIADNLLDGGGYTLYCNAGPVVPELVVIGNRFARSYHPEGGHWGPTTGCEHADTFRGNIWDDSGDAAGGENRGPAPAEEAETPAPPEEAETPAPAEEAETPAPPEEAETPAPAEEAETPAPPEASETPTP